MHLILSSCDFSNLNSRKCILENLRKPIEKSKVLFFPNENATQESINSEKYHSWMIDRGFKRKNIYVFDYYNPYEFSNLDIDCIHISGGNTFKTLDRIKNCQANELILNYILKGITYIGGSAGAHIVTKNIEHLLPIDKNTTGITDFKALGLFDGILFCHYTEKLKEYYDKAVRNNDIAVYKLTNDESIVIDD